jgi:hypothetical protein
MEVDSMPSRLVCIGDVGKMVKISRSFVDRPRGIATVTHEVASRAVGRFGILHSQFTICGVRWFNIHFVTPIPPSLINRDARAIISIGSDEDSAEFLEHIQPDDVCSSRLDIMYGQKVKMTHDAGPEVFGRFGEFQLIYVNNLHEVTYLIKFGKKVLRGGSYVDECYFKKICFELVSPNDICSSRWVDVSQYAYMCRMVRDSSRIEADPCVH